MRARYVGVMVIVTGLIVVMLVALRTHGVPAAVSSVDGIPPGSGPLWLTSPPRFAGKILHGTVANSMQSSTTDGGIIDKRETGEFWIELDSDGSLLRSHEVFRANDGVVTQESLYRDGMETVRYGNNVSRASSACREAFANPMPRVVPPFAVDAATLKSLGFTSVQPGNWDMPVTPFLNGVDPTRTYRLNGDDQAWEQRFVLDGGSIRGVYLEVDESGRFIVMNGWDEDVVGRVSNIVQQIYGDLDVYSADSVVENVFESLSNTESQCTIEISRCLKM